MPVRRRRLGRTTGGRHQGPRDVDAIELDVGGGNHAVVVTYGATLARLEIADAHHRRVPVLSCHGDLDRFATTGHPYRGATVGRFARNISHARLELDGVEHQLDANDRGHHMHGGADGFSRRVWDAEPVEGTCGVRLRLVSPDGDQGYPGELTAETVVELDDDRLVLTHSATTTAPTVVDLTNHAYWNLAGSGTVDDHVLRVDAARAVDFLPGMVPAPGPPGQVTGTEHDLREGRALRGLALDRYFVLDADGGAVLTHLPTGRTMSVTTDRPGLGVYTADRTPPSRSGVTLQASAMPDAPNRADFPSARLDPGQVYESRTEHRFSGFGCRS